MLLSSPQRKSSQMLLIKSQYVTTTQTFICCNFSCWLDLTASYNRNRLQNCFCTRLDEIWSNSILQNCRCWWLKPGCCQLTLLYPNTRNDSQVGLVGLKFKLDDITREKKKQARNTSILLDGIAPSFCRAVFKSLLLFITGSLCTPSAATNMVICK